MAKWLPAAARHPLLEGVRVALAALPEKSPPAEIATTLPVAIAALIRVRDGKEPVEPDRSLTTAADFLRMMKGRPAAANELGALETYFTTVCENGFNNASFAARVTVSSRASLASAVTSAYCAFHRSTAWRRAWPGARHARRHQGIRQHRRLDREKSSQRGERLMGFGHRVFRIRDPRADVLRAAVASLNKDAGLLAFAFSEVEKAALAALKRHKPGRSLQSNIEMNAALLLDAVGVPRDAFTPVFAITRSASWLAHAIEQQKTGRMIRPEANYIGPKPT